MDSPMDQHTAPDGEIDTMNKFMVASQGDKLVLLNPPRGHISKDDALLLAAYLVAMADGHDRFTRVYDAVCNT